MLSITLVSGTATRPGRLNAAVGAAAEAVDAAGHRAHVLNLADLRIAPADGRPPEALGDDTADVIAAVDGADGVLLATPVYRASLTGTLKNLLDHLPVPALRGTPVGIVTMGGSDHHHEAAERHLRDILAFFGALAAPSAVYLTPADFADGEPRDDACVRLAELADTVARLAAWRASSPAPLGPAPLWDR